MGLTGAETLREMLGYASRVAIFTGAGISTESGIPDFRSPGGFWTRMKPIEFQDFLSNAEARRETWRRRFGGPDLLTTSEPNAGHHALARLIARGKAKAIITQNIDDLHQRAGVPADRVIEIHGTAAYAKCLRCDKRYELDEIRRRFEATGDAPDCGCGGFIKTATISFGQPMPEREMERAQAEAKSCDLFLAIGSSLTVYPAAGLPILAKRNGAALVILNRDPTELDPYADLVLNEEIGPVLSHAIPPD